MTCRRVCWFFGAVIAQLLIVGVCGAVEIVEAQTDFRIQLDAPGAIVCVVYPEPKQKTEGCTDLPAVDVQALNKHGSLFTHVIVVFSDWRISVTGILTKTLTEGSPSDEDLANFEAGVKKRAGSAASRFERLRIGEARALSFERTMEHDGQPLVQISYFVYGDRGIPTLSFVAPAAHIEDLRRLTDASRKTWSVRAPAPVPAARKVSRVFDAFRVAIAVALGLVLLGGVAGWLWQRTEKALSPPQRAAKASMLSVALALAAFASLQIFRDDRLLPEQVMLGVTLASCALPVAGLLCGGYALASVPKHGRPGILKPGLLGTVLSIGLLALIVAGVMSAMRRG